ncbi:MAG: hypothetical protein ACR2F8_09405 [Caulobacteraceae bacterium]
MDADRTTAKAQGAADKARGAFNGRVDDVRETIRNTAEQAKGAAQDLYGRAAGRAQDVAGNVDAMIGEQPYAALAVAAVAGVAVGLILGLTIASRD